MKSQKTECNCLGFSLVELSIVLVIIGLLIGGVLSGRDLIKASELRSVITQHEQFYTAIQTFKEKYFFLPGDLPNATQIWGALDPNAALCNPMPSTTARTCNGNGNGLVERINNEDFRFWQHLANSGLVVGSYSGVAVSLPSGKIKNTLWRPIELGDITSGGVGASQFVGHYGLSLWLYNNNDMNFLKPEEAYYIDKKIDDGKPGAGSLVSIGYVESDFFDNPSECTTTDDTTMITADYKLTSTRVVCYLIFRGM